MQCPSSIRPHKFRQNVLKNKLEQDNLNTTLGKIRNNLKRPRWRGLHKGKMKFILLTNREKYPIKKMKLKKQHYRTEMYIYRVTWEQQKFAKDQRIKEYMHFVNTDKRNNDVC